MNEKEYLGKNNADIFSRVLKAGRRTYFFDVRETKAGDYYLTITESKRSQNQDGTYSYKKHKIYLYKEDFSEFNDLLNDSFEFVLKEKGKEVISERHDKNFKNDSERFIETEVLNTNIPSDNLPEQENDNLDKFTDLDFEEI